MMFHVKHSRVLVNISDLLSPMQRTSGEPDTLGSLPLRSFLIAN
jgi:hypothetical protein